VSTHWSNIILISLILISLLFHSSVLNAHIIRIPVDFPTIQAGIDGAEDGDTVLVDRGIYAENINFHAQSILLTSYYLFDEDTLTIRNTVIDGQNNGSTVVFASYEFIHSVINGFLIRGGDAVFGGGITCWLSSPTISNNIIKNNSAEQGGGIYCKSSEARILNNALLGNTATSAGGGLCAWWCELIINGNTIMHNDASAGGGVYANEDQRFHMTDNIIAYNETNGYGGGLYFESADLFSQNIDVLIEHNKFLGNSAGGDGGGLNSYSSHYNYPNLRIRIMNNVFQDNYGGRGGGMGFRCIGDFRSWLINNTFLNNRASSHGGGLYCHSDLSYNKTSSMSFFVNSNNIFQGNVSEGGSGGGVYCKDESTVEYNNFWDNSPENCYSCTIGTGNIFCDPELDNPTGYEPILSAASPCIDSGTEHDTQKTGEWPPGDQTYYHRTTVNRTGGDRPDMGAQEYKVLFTDTILQFSNEPESVSIADTLLWTARIKNRYHTPMVTDMWIDLSGTSGCFNIKRFMGVTLEPYQQIDLTVSFPVPLYLDTGLHTIHGKVGEYESAIRDIETFDIFVVQ